MKNIKVIALAFFTLGVTGLASAQSEPEQKTSTETQATEVQQDVQQIETAETQEAKDVQVESKTDHSTQGTEESVKMEVPPTSATKLEAVKED